MKGVQDAIIQGGVFDLFFEYGKGKKMTPTQYSQVLAAVAANESVDTVALGQMHFQDGRNGALTLGSFVAQLLSNTSQVRGIRFYQTVLTDKQISDVCQAVAAHGGNLKHINFAFCNDDAHTDSCVASMLTSPQLRQLETFQSSLTDDCRSFAVLKAAMRMPCLRELKLPYTCHPMFPFELDTDNTNLHVLVHFESAKRFFSVQLVQSERRSANACLYGCEVTQDLIDRWRPVIQSHEQPFATKKQKVIKTTAQ